jgi:hypothetical protein
LEKLLAARSVSETKPESKPVNLLDKDSESQPVDEPVQPSVGQRLLPWAKSLWPGLILVLPPLLRVITSRLADKNFLEQPLSLSSSLPERLAQGDTFVTFVLLRAFALAFDFLPLLDESEKAIWWLRGKGPVLRDAYSSCPEVCQCGSDAVCSKLKQLGYKEADLVKVKYMPVHHPDAAEWVDNACASNGLDTYPTIVLGPVVVRPDRRDRTVSILFHEAGHLWHQFAKKEVFFKSLALASGLLMRGVCMWSGISTNVPQKLQWLKMYLAILGVHCPENNGEALCLLGGSIMRLVLWKSLGPKANYLTPVSMVALNAYARRHERLADSFAVQHAPLSAQGLLASAQRYRELAASESLEYGKRAWYGRAWHWLSYYLFEDHPTHSSRAEFFQKAYIKRLWMVKCEQVISPQTDKNRLLQKAFAAVGKNNTNPPGI